MNLSGDILIDNNRSRSPIFEFNIPAVDVGSIVADDFDGIESIVAGIGSVELNIHVITTVLVELH